MAKFRRAQFSEKEVFNQLRDVAKTNVELSLIP